MKILFIAKGQETLAIEYLSASLKSAGHKVELLFDPGFDGSMGFLNLPFWRRLYSPQFLIDNVGKIGPDLIAMSCPLHLYPFVKETARVLKQHFNTPIIVGGGHPTLAPDYLMQNKDIDFICLGEGEEPLVELADLMERDVDYSHTRNLWLRRNGKIITNPVRSLLEDLDSLPFPDRDLYHKFGCFAGNLYFIAGRGCPFRCTYCCQHSFRNLYQGKGKYVRFRSVENVIQELEECVQKYEVKHIHSEDDLFSIDPRWLSDFCDEYKKKINLHFYCHLRPGTLTKDMVKKLKEAGCKVLYLGIDSGNEYIRRDILERNIKDKVIYEQALLTKREGLKLACSSMYALPGETSQQMLDTFKMLEEIKCDHAYTTIYYPFYGTKLYHYAIEKGYLKEEAIKKIKEGLGSPYQYSMLVNENNDLAMILKNTIPPYIRFRTLRPLIGLIIKYRWLKISYLVNFLFTPFAYGKLGRMKRREITKTLFTFLQYRLKFKPIEHIIDTSKENS